MNLQHSLGRDRDCAHVCNHPRTLTPMPGVIALLDDEHHAQVEWLWAEMERAFGIPAGYPGAMPHVTFHLAGGYDPAPTLAAVAEIAAAQPPFQLRTTGLGVFTGAAPVIHIPVVRNEDADRLHRRLYEALAPFCQEHAAYYSPTHWMPHITLGYKNVPQEAHAQVLPWLAAQDLAWVIHVTTLAVGQDTPTGVEITASFPLGAPSGGA